LSHNKKTGIVGDLESYIKDGGRSNKVGFYMENNTEFGNKANDLSTFSLNKQKFHNMKFFPYTIVKGDYNKALKIKFSQGTYLIEERRNFYYTDNKEIFPLSFLYKVGSDNLIIRSKNNGIREGTTSYNNNDKSEKSPNRINKNKLNLKVDITSDNSNYKKLTFPRRVSKISNLFQPEKDFKQTNNLFKITSKSKI
jgi:hypothetical protein